MGQMRLSIKFFVGSQELDEEKNKKQKQNKFGAISTGEIQEITENAVPVTTKSHKVRMRIFNGTSPLSFPKKL